MVTGRDHQAPPRISAVVPVWDSYTGAFLHEALASLLGEERVATVIVVDNASDPPVSVDDARVVVVRSAERVSCGAARNLGLDHVRTPLMLMWDADDVLLPGALHLLHERMTADDAVVAAAAAIVDPPSGTRHRWPRRWISWLTGHPRLLAMTNAVWSQYPTIGATLMRTDVVRDAGGYAEGDRVSEDWSLGATLLWRGRVAWYEHPGRLYRRHPMSSWNKHNGTGRLLANSRAVRAALRTDPAVPRWFTRSLPLVQIAQYAALLVVQPAVRLLRGGRTV